MAKAAAKKKQSKGNPRLGVQEAIEQGVSAIQKGNRQEAYTLFEKTAEVHPNVSEVWVWLGGTSPDLDSAETAFERAYSLNPDNEEASLGLRWVRLRRKASLADIVGATVPMPAPISGASAVGAASGGTATPLHSQPLSHFLPGDVAGAEASLTCPNCGKMNKASERFCVDCGQGLATGQARDTVEREHAAYIQAPQNKGLRANRTLLIVAVIAVALAVGAFLYWYAQVRPH